MRLLPLIGTVLVVSLCSFKAHAIVTYLNCPTLQPLPVTNFMPGAMLPIENVISAYDVGMNSVIKTAIDMAGQKQVQAINDDFTNIMKAMIKISRSQQQQELELDRQMADMKRSYTSKLAAEKERTKNMLFPSDPAMTPIEGGASPIVSVDSPTYKFVKQLCSAAKMQQLSSGKQVRDKALSSMNRRNQKIMSNMQAVSNVNVAAKRNLDMHYDLFCSKEDADEGSCETSSIAPNADISAFNFLFPVGYVQENDELSEEYRTIYTYSAVESLAAYQYIKNLSGVMYVTPPVTGDYTSDSKMLFVATYKQMVSALSISTDVMLSIAQSREPVNSEGVALSTMDALNYQLHQSNMPHVKRIVRSASPSGKMLELQKQMAISNKLKHMLLKQKEQMRTLEAVELSVDMTLISLDR
jgi:hypothetical protein